MTAAPDKPREKAGFRNNISTRSVFCECQIHGGDDVHGGEPQGCVGERFAGAHPIIDYRCHERKRWSMTLHGTLTAAQSRRQLGPGLYGQAPQVTVQYIGQGKTARAPSIVQGSESSTYV